MIKNILITLFVGLLSQDLWGQTEMKPSELDTVWFHLSPKDKHVVINGISVGWTIHPWSTWTDTCFVEMNGLNIEVGPLGIIGGIWGSMVGLIGVKDVNGNKTSFFSRHQPTANNVHVKYGTYVHGFSVSVGGITETFNKGVIINGLSCTSFRTTGLLISGLINSNNEFNGVSIAALANTAQKAKGLQIGLINNCTTGKVLQIGLFNRIGKRVMPLINFGFKE